MDNRNQRDRNGNSSDAAFPDALLKAIVGIEIPIDRLEGKFKLSQNKSPENQQGVIAALEQAHHSDAQAVVRIMREHVKRRRGT